MGKLIIRHGDILTEHALGESPVVIGRDPDCHLFFADRKLSRRHACIEREATGFRILDLGSRNGSWVNEERVDRRQLVSGDEIRVGDVLMSFVHEDERAGEEPTVYLGSPDSDETATVVLGAGDSSEERRSPGEPSDPDGSSTRILAVNEEDRPSDASSTQLLPGDYAGLSGGSSSEDPSTQFLSRKGTAFGSVAEDSSTRVLPPDAFEESEVTLQRPEGRSPVERNLLRPGPLVVERPDSGTVVYRDEEERATERAQPGGVEDESSERFLEAAWEARAPGGGSWTLRFAVTTSLLVLFTVVVLVVPLYSTSRRALNEESRARGRALMELLAALNEVPLGEGKPEDASIVMVERAPGVSGAFVLDTTGKIVAPGSRAGEVLSVGGLDVPPRNVRSIRSGQTRAGESVVAGPINYLSKRVGVAVVIQRPAEGTAAFALLLGLALVLMALAATVVFVGRMTLTPIEELRREIESVGRGEGRYVDDARPFQELSHLARAVNRLVDSAARRLSNQGKEQR